MSSVQITTKATAEFANSCLLELPNHILAVSPSSCCISPIYAIEEAGWTVKLLSTLIALASHSRPSRDSTDHSLGSKIGEFCEECSRGIGMIFRALDTVDEHLAFVFKHKTPEANCLHHEIVAPCLSAIGDVHVNNLASAVFCALLSIERLMRTERRGVIEVIITRPLVN